MSDIILTIIILIIISGFLRRIIFSSAYNAFQRAANDFSKRNNPTNKPKEYWDNKTSKSKNNNNDSGEYIDYEEIK